MDKEKNITLKRMFLVVLVSFLAIALFSEIASAASISKTWSCNNGLLGGCSTQYVSAYKNGKDALNCGNARPVIGDPNKQDFAFRWSNYSFNAPNAGEYSCTFSIVETAYGYYDGAQTQEHLAVRVNSIFLRNTVDGGCNSGNSCASCTDYTNTFTTTLNLKSGNNVLSLEAFDSHALRSVSISCNLLSVCEPSLINKTLSDWTDDSQCKDGKRRQIKTILQYDSKFCGIIQNETFVVDRYLDPNFSIIVSQTPWENVTQCRPNNTQLQKSNIIERDLNGCANDKTGTQYREVSCNYVPSENPPIITINNPENNSEHININHLLLNATSNQLITNWSININGNMKYRENSYSYILLDIFNELVNGTNTLEVCGTNINGTGCESIIFFVLFTSSGEGTKPNITIHEPVEGGTYESNGTILINASSDQEIENWTIIFNDELIIIDGNNSKNLITNLTGVKNGTNYLKICGTNINGTGCEEKTFNVSLVGGNGSGIYIKINNPENKTYTNKNLLLNIGSNGTNIWYNWNGTNYTYTNPINIAFNNGSNTLHAWANDSNGNKVYTNVTFYINATNGGNDNGGDNGNGNNGNGNGGKCKNNCCWCEDEEEEDETDETTISLGGQTQQTGNNIILPSKNKQAKSNMGWQLALIIFVVVAILIIALLLIF